MSGQKVMDTRVNELLYQFDRAVKEHNLKFAGHVIREIADYARVHPECRSELADQARKLLVKDLKEVRDELLHAGERLVRKGLLPDLRIGGAEQYPHGERQNHFSPVLSRASEYRGTSAQETNAAAVPPWAVGPVTGFNTWTNFGRGAAHGYGAVEAAAVESEAATIVGGTADALILSEEAADILEGAELIAPLYLL